MLGPANTKGATAAPSIPQKSIKSKFLPFRNISRLHAHEGGDSGGAPPTPAAAEPRAPAQQASRRSAAAAPQASAPTPPPPPPAAPPSPPPAAMSPSAQQQAAPKSGKALRAAAGRPLFFASEDTLLYLDGSLPGDYGFDPLGLVDQKAPHDPDNAMSLTWLSYAEVIHCRWAMLAAAGAVAPEALAKWGVTPAATGLPWFQAGGLDSATNLIAIPFAGPIPFTYWTDQYTLLWTMLVAMGFAETRRWQDYKAPGSNRKQWFLGMEKLFGGSGSPAYPGGPFFNFAGLGKSEDEMRTLKTKEIKNGRLAMLAFFGMMIQAQTTHSGPVQNLVDHVSSPLTANVATRITDFFMARGGQ